MSLTVINVSSKSNFVHDVKYWTIFHYKRSSDFFGKFCEFASFLSNALDLLHYIQHKKKPLTNSFSDSLSYNIKSSSIGMSVTFNFTTPLPIKLSNVIQNGSWINHVFFLIQFKVTIWNWFPSEHVLMVINLQINYHRSYIALHNVLYSVPVLVWTEINYKNYERNVIQCAGAQLSDFS